MTCDANSDQIIQLKTMTILKLAQLADFRLQQLALFIAYKQC